ncbi:MAG: pilus assembly protein PilM, partial [Ruminiclostridium sp.]|nr:pilus assembly protein PilM [Ruminiclostridium sp.]
MDIEQILKRNGKKAAAAEPVQGDRIFALDIGTRTVVGIIGERDGDKFKILECVSKPHTRRAMVDGQVEDIKQVAKIVGEVKAQLEEKIGCTLQRACIAAAGRALRTVNISKDFDVSGSEFVTEEMVASMEMETISLAQSQLDEETKGDGTLFYCVGHNVVSYLLDDYKMISLTGHKGQKAQINMVVAFLPGIVVEGLYSVMELNKLEVQSLTLEPIAAMNVIIPPEIRLINIALVDIGAGTSDIAISKDGSIIAYAMATVAGDEITEEIIKTYLVDFSAAEQMKYDADTGEAIKYKDIFGIPHSVTQEDFIESILSGMDNLAATICNTILKINGGSPQAVFLVGGGSLIKGLTTLVADKLDIDEDRVAVGSGEFVRGVDIGAFKMGAEYITPIGIGVTALNDRGYDFSVITVNDKKVRVFDTKKLTVFQLLSAAGFKAAEIMGHSGQGLTFTLNGNKIFRKGTLMTSAEITVNGKNAGLTTVVTQGD